jgi:hypothetical protein
MLPLHTAVEVALCGLLLGLGVWMAAAPSSLPLPVQPSGFM